MNLTTKILDTILFIITFLVMLYLGAIALLGATVQLLELYARSGHNPLVLLGLFALAAWQFHRKKWVK